MYCVGSSAFTRSDETTTIPAEVANFSLTAKGLLADHVGGAVATDPVSLYNGVIGPYLLIALLLPTGILLTVVLRAIQIRRLGHAVGLVAGRYDDHKDAGDVSHFQALTTALSATVGIGNIAGVAMAIHLGGPGSVVWMWITGFLGMAIKYSECLLALKYRDFDDRGEVAGGPMFYIRKALRPKIGRIAVVMAVMFAAAGAFCALCSGNMVQSNSMAFGLAKDYGVNTWLSGGVIAIAAFLVIVGGIKRIGRFASYLVPFMGVAYVVAALVVIFANIDRVPAAFSLIFSDAFSGKAAMGGFVATMLWGVQRGLFSNEAGQGSAPIAHAAAKTEYPVREGLVALTEPLIDTLLICTMTALVVVMCGDYGSIASTALTSDAFTKGLGTIGLGMTGTHLVNVAAVLFAFSTAVSWSYYGDRCVRYLFNSHAAVMSYRVLFCVALFFGASIKLDMVWAIADMAISLMALPNLVALLILTPEIMRETKAYFAIKHIPVKKRRAAVAGSATVDE